jgi:hypothetical protein
MDEPHVHTGRLDPVAHASQGLVDDVDPVTRQPRFASWIPQMPLPVPRSSARPWGGSRPFSSRSKTSVIFSRNGGSDSASSHGWKPSA